MPDHGAQKMSTQIVARRRRRGIGWLAALTVGRATKPGMYADGGGLYLQVSHEGARSWIFRYRAGGRTTPRDMGLGSLITVTLAEAREKARVARGQLLDGADPIEARRTARAKTTKFMTFKECAAAYIEAHQPGWRNEKHTEQWRVSLETYAYPSLGSFSVQAVDVDLVMKVLEPIWNEKTETAARIRGRIEAILDWAHTRGLREGDNPARWRGHLENLLPARNRVAKPRHHPALPFAEVGAFVAQLRQEQGIAARGLEFLILTAARTSEVTGATPAEVNRQKSLWTVPADRIKAGREHRVPLSARALEILEEAGSASVSYLFPGGRRGQPLSESAFRALLHRMDRPDLTAHGFRSTFRDWASERTRYPHEVAEMALAHTIPSGVERAYRRGDLFAKRARMMSDWARFCEALSERESVKSAVR